MKHKIELLAHIDAPTRKEVLRWCREYEDDIAQLKKQCNAIGATQLPEDAHDSAQRVVFNIKAALKKSTQCRVYFTPQGQFKVMTQSARIEKEPEESTLVGVFGDDFDPRQVIKDCVCILNDARVKTAP